MRQIFSNVLRIQALQLDANSLFFVFIRLFKLFCFLSPSLSIHFSELRAFLFFLILSLFFSSILLMKHSVLFGYFRSILYLKYNYFLFSNQMLLIEKFHVMSAFISIFHCQNHQQTHNIIYGQSFILTIHPINQPLMVENHHLR